MDLSKLSPAPWTADGPKTNNGLYDVRTEYRGGFATFPAPNLDRTNAEFIALARNAFDIMLRRNWTPFLASDGNWDVIAADTGGVPDELEAEAPGHLPLSWGSDPFSALVAANRWLKERETTAKPPHG